MQARLYKDKQQEMKSMYKMPKNTEFRYKKKYAFFVYVENFMQSSYVEQHLKDKELFL